VTVTVESGAFDPAIDTVVSGWMTPGPIDQPPTAAAGVAIARSSATAKTKVSAPIAPTAGKEDRVMGTANPSGLPRLP
jgi:hypothetical protein